MSKEPLYTYTLSLKGPHDAVYRLLQTDKYARVQEISRESLGSSSLLVSVLVHLTLPKAQLKALLTQYKVSYKVLALNGYPTSCPLVSEALRADMEQ